MTRRADRPATRHAQVRWAGPSSAPYFDAVEAAVIALAEACPAGLVLHAALEAVLALDPAVRGRLDARLERAFAAAGALDDAWRAREEGRP